MKLRFETALFDVDGTLIDSNGAHAESWAQAMREHGVIVTAAAVRPLVGMGGDKLLPAIAGIEADSEEGKQITQRKKALFAEYLPGLQPTRGARALVQFLRTGGIAPVIATSADEQEMAALLKQAGVDDLFPDRASKDDASASKPDPDIVHAAMERSRARPETTVMIGDTPYDIEAAARAGIPAIALRCGGYWLDDDLRGAMAMLDHPEALLQDLRAGRL
jgi:HAD superfamily hydrolase (TIGR01509 family)